MKMYKLIPILLFALAMSPTANAVDGTGSVDEIMSCSTGYGGANWKQMLLFKLSDGQWFGIFADHSGTAAEYDNSFTVSLVMTAYVSRVPVLVKATGGNSTFCGIPVSKIYNNAGDYIRLSR